MLLKCQVSAWSAETRWPATGSNGRGGGVVSGAVDKRFLSLSNVTAAAAEPPFMWRGLRCDGSWGRIALLQIRHAQAKEDETMAKTKKNQKQHGSLYQHPVATVHSHKMLFLHQH